MSVSVASTAASAAKQAPSIPIHHPNTPFASLLRRSRFASFDPQIRQTYFSPDAHASRGDYGLKRPLPLKRRNSFIALASYDEHHNFTEWTSGESQVRFLRRFEELNTAAHPDPTTTWRKNLGQLHDNWLVDSEFEHTSSSSSSKAPESEPPQPELGTRGRGQYGKNRSTVNIYSATETGPEPEVEDVTKRLLVPNLNAMTPRQFRSYLRKIRRLRPEFQAYVQAKETNSASEHASSTAGSDLLDIAKDPMPSFHLQTQFINSKMQDQFHSMNYRSEGDGKPKIMQLPHPNAGLMYAHPSKLQTKIGTQYVVSKHYPGYILHVADQPGRVVRKDARSSTFETRHIVAVGGLAATSNIRGQDRDQIKRALYNPWSSSEEGGGITNDPERVEEATAELTLSLQSNNSVAPIVMHRPPRIVGSYKNIRGNPAGLRGASIRAEFELRDNAASSRSFGNFDSNKYWPGNRLYNSGGEGIAPRPHQLGGGGAFYANGNVVAARVRGRSKKDANLLQRQNAAGNQQVINRLAAMTKIGNKNFPKPRKDL